MYLIHIIQLSKKTNTSSDINDEENEFKKKCLKNKNINGKYQSHYKNKRIDC